MCCIFQAILTLTERPFSVRLYHSRKNMATKYRPFREILPKFQAFSSQLASDSRHTQDLTTLKPPNRLEFIEMITEITQVTKITSAVSNSTRHTFISL